jgi:hypothetical protein
MKSNNPTHFRHFYLPWITSGMSGMARIPMPFYKEGILNLDDLIKSWRRERNQDDYTDTLTSYKWYIQSNLVTLDITYEVNGYKSSRISFIFPTLSRRPKVCYTTFQGVIVYEG